MNLLDPRFRYVSAARTPTEGVLARWLEQTRAEREKQAAQAPSKVLRMAKRKKA